MQETAAVSRVSVCGVALGQAALRLGRKLGARSADPRGATAGWSGAETMPIVETEVEKPAAQGAAMEITVSRQELVKELTAMTGRPIE